MTRFMAIATVALMATCAWAQEPLASVDAGEATSGDWTAQAAFETAEYQWDATVRIDGPGTLALCYPGDGRMALKTVEGPTEEPQSVSLHLRANPDADRSAWPLPIQWRFSADGAPATCWVTTAGAAPEPLYQHAIPRVSEPPVIDGDLSDRCWDDAAYIGDAYWRMYNEPRDAKMATYVWCAYDDENLYVAFRCETPSVKRLLADIPSRDGYVWRDDSAEIFMDFGHDHDTYYEYNINPKGIVFDGKWFNDGGQWLTDWNYIGEWQTAIEPGAYIAEIRIALESYERRDLRGNPTGEMPLPTGDVAGILFSRNDRVVGEGMSHADCAPSFHEVDQYGHLVGFRPNRVEAYRKTALGEIERLEGRRRTLELAAATTLGGVEIDRLTQLRRRVEAPAPDFDEWVAIRDEISSLDGYLNSQRSLLAPVIARRQTEDAPWALMTADATQPNALPGEAYSDTLQATERVTLSGAGGECVPIVLAIAAEADAGEIGVLPEALTGPGGSLDGIAWYRIDGGGRLVPNAPISGAETGRIWWEIDIPRDAAPGVYQGEIVTTDGERRVTLPVELTVYDFTLPVTPSLAVSVGFDAKHVMQQWYGERSPLGAGEYWPYAEALLKHGVVPREMLADFTWWGDREIDLGGANRMLERAWPYQPAMRVMIAARPEQLNALAQPRKPLERAVDHWEDITDVYPMRTYVPAGVPVPEIGRRQRNGSVAVAQPGMALAPIAELGTWAIAPEIAAGFGGCEGAELTADASEAEVAKAWRMDSVPDAMYTRMLGVLADDYRVGRIFWDAPDEGDLCASGLLWCRSEDGARLVDPQPTVTLKLLREALEDYEYLRIARDLYRASRVLQSPERLSRLRLATDGQYRRNWDMVMNIRDFNRDPEHLAGQRAVTAEEIVRAREMLRRALPDAELPGDPGR